MKTIIRVEHEDGIGMFQSFQRPHATMHILPELDERHAHFHTPSEEGLHMTSNEYCAYKSISHIQEWIQPEEFPILFQNGYKVWMIDVLIWREGKHNILFRKEDIISKKDISSLFLSN